MADIFSQEQIEKFRVIFEQFDKNGDGDISAKELKGALKQLGQVTDTKSCKKMIKAVKTASVLVLGIVSCCRAQLQLFIALRL